MKTPDHIYELARKNKERADKLIEQAKQQIPENYHNFIVMLNEKIKLSDEIVYIDDRTFILGVWSKEGLGTWQTIQRPYLTVDGRILWARNEHREYGKMLNIHEPVISADGKTMTVVVVSEMLGKSTGIIEIQNTPGIGRDHPYAIAQTSAIGRALGFLGYGLIGSGVYSEELQVTEEPAAFTAGADNEPKEITVIAVSEPEIKETHATFKAVFENEDVEVTIPITKQKEIKRIKPGYTVNGHAWIIGNNVRFSADNSIHVASGVKRLKLTIDNKPKFSRDGSSVFNAMLDDQKYIVNAPSALKEQVKELSPGKQIEVDGLIIKGIIKLPRKNTIVFVDQ